ncbi:MAG: Maf family protein [Patescibacteria group bacterium]|nr:Maf family protein [Patescibacteria group bacterium]
MLYLASESSRRKELLGWTGLDFEVVEHGVDEDEYRGSDGKKMVKELSLAKAYGGSRGLKKGLVIGSDLTVEFEGKQLGKPKNIKETKKMLESLAGKEHMIYTGVAVVDSKSMEGRLSVCETKVKMKDYDDEIIKRYIKKFNLMDKAGGFSIRYKLDGFGSLVEKIEGSFTNVLGFPLEYLENLLKEFGMEAKKDWRKKCKMETGYEG